MTEKNKYVKHSHISEGKFREIEVDESYFRARRVKGKRGRWTHGKTIVFGLLKRERK